MAKLRMPPGCRDVTAQRRGTVFTLVGTNRPTVPQGFFDVMREGGIVRAIIGYPSPTDGNRRFQFGNLPKDDEDENGGTLH
jgi:hypothetical protein